MAAERIKKLPTYERVRELFHYDQKIGCLFWKKPSGNRVKRGDRAGAYSTHCRIVGVDGRRQKEHRIIWLWMTGVWPTQRIDHKDLNGFNNKWKNLREATNSQNGANKSRQANNSTGLKGAYRNNGVYMSRIQKDDVDYYLGCFPTPLAAHRAYDKKATELFGEFARAV